jgi:hypothetical protein
MRLLYPLPYLRPTTHGAFLARLYNSDVCNRGAPPARVRKTLFNVFDISSADRADISPGHQKHPTRPSQTSNLTLSLVSLTPAFLSLFCLPHGATGRPRPLTALALTRCRAPQHTAFGTRFTLCSAFLIPEPTGLGQFGAQRELSPSLTRTGSIGHCPFFPFV